MEPFPEFYRREDVPKVFVERGGLVAEAAARSAASEALPPAAGDRFRIAVLAIDCQVAFCTPGASLFVPGAVEDTTRAIEWIYGNLERLTTLVFTMDTHSVFQVFHPASWRDAAGRPPEPFSIITARDVKEGRWMPQLKFGGPGADPRAWALEYCEKLEAGGRYVLTIWPYHALLGGLSHALVPSLMEAALFHSFRRGVDPVIEIKGRSPYTENYSALAPEVRELAGEPVGVFNRSLFQALMSHDRVYVFGQAKSHCVLETLRDLARTAAAENPRLLDKVFILEDAMSPVPPPPIDPLPAALDFPRVAEAAMRELAVAGMHLVRTTDRVAIPGA